MSFPDPISSNISISTHRFSDSPSVSQQSTSIKYLSYSVKTTDPANQNTLIPSDIVTKKQEVQESEPKSLKSHQIQYLPPKKTQDMKKERNNTESPVDDPSERSSLTRALVRGLKSIKGIIQEMKYKKSNRTASDIERVFKNT